MQASEQLIEAIKAFEGFRSTAYEDAGGTLTIGYGDTNAVRPGETITPAFADLALRAELADKAPQVARSVTATLNQAQFDALLDFAFNLGVGALQGSALLKYLNRGDYGNAASEFPLWCHVGSRRIDGLYVRRMAERAWFTGEMPVGYPSTQQRQAWLAPELQSA